MAEPTSIATITPSISARIERLAERAASGELPTELSRPAGLEPPMPRDGVPPGIPSRFAGARLGQLDGHIRELATSWVDGGMNANVVLLGSVGTGKTHAACAMAIAAHQAGSTVVFAPVVELLDGLRPGGDPQAMHRAIHANVLVLDDLGGERPTDWTGERLYAVINRRWLEQRPTIATSNLAPDALEAAVGPRAWSRLYHGALRLRVAGDDRRRT
jgi:hypothetical protein